MKKSLIDGTIQFEFNQEGEARELEGMLEVFDHRLDAGEFHDSEIGEQLLDVLPKYKDCLVMVLFKFVVLGDGEDCEWTFHPVHHHVIQEDWKEFERRNLTHTLENTLYTEEQVGVEEWEAFHNEDFKPYVYPKRRLID